VSESVDLRIEMQDYLQDRGLDTVTARGVAAASTLLPAIRPDVTALDVDSEDGDAYALIKPILAVGSSCIVISKHIDMNDGVRSLQLGADDYVSKPFNMEELYLRLLKILARRPQESDQPSTILDLEGVKVDLVKRSVIGRDSHPDVEVTEAELALLRFLSENKDRLINHESIYAAIHGQPYQAKNRRALEVAMSRLRIKLKASGNGIEIRSVRRAGWLLSREPASI
jgi:DNA-binding response OmpR family regulator